MRRLVLLVLLLSAACAPAPAPTPAPSPAKPPVTLKPLGPCPASSWRPEAPPPTASAKVSMVLLAVQEWARFGRQTIDLLGGGPPRTEQLGVPERDAPERVRDYWKSVDKPERSGLDRRAVVGGVHLVGHRAAPACSRDLFCPDRATRSMSSAWSSAPAGPAPAFVPLPADRSAGPRSATFMRLARRRRTTLENLDRGPGHCDIVVEVRPGEVHAIGGNVGDFGDPQRLSTGRQRVFGAHIRPAFLYRDREQTALGRGTMSWPYDYIIIGAGSAGCVHRQPPGRGSRAAHPAARGRAARHVLHAQDAGGLRQPRREDAVQLALRDRCRRRTATTGACTGRAARRWAARRRSTPCSTSAATPGTTTTGASSATRAGATTTCCRTSRRPRTTSAAPTTSTAPAGR